MTEHAKTFNKRSIVAAVASVVLAVGLMLPASLAYATPTASSKQAEADAALAQLNSLQAEMDEASTNYQAALQEQMDAQAKVEEAEAQIEEATATIQEGQEKLSERARAMYRSGGNSFLDVILGASTFEEFALNWNILETLNQNDADLVAETKQARETLETAKAEAQEQEQIAANKADEAKAVAEAAEAKAAEMQSVYDSLSAEAAELVEQEQAAEDSAQAASVAESVNNGTANSNNTAGTTVDNGKAQTVSGNAVVQRAYACLGKPYSWGATGPNSFDCSGLVGYCLTGSTGRWCTSGSIAGWTAVSDPQPGDICVKSGHVGIYIGGGQMIHAPQSGDVVKISAVQSGMWFVRY